jgi:hypothetical protein
MKSINIYCLIDPRNNKPFYVGATESNIKHRLSNHISEVKTYSKDYWSDKIKLIKEIMQDNKRPVVMLLCVCDISSVDHYEAFYYNLFISQGYELLQRAQGLSYAKKRKTDLAKLS